MYIIFGSILLALLIGIVGINYFSKPSLDDIKESVVMIKTYDHSGNLIGTGSGFCIFEENYIMTNYHVIEGATYVDIITNDKTEYSARKVLIYDWEGNDVALLETDTNLKPLKRNKYPKLKTGENIIAIGSPLGELNTVSTGIISNADNNGDLQITAAISPGSSGGVLLDKNHKVIGMTYASIVEGQNLNYAIPEGIIENMYKYFKSGANEKSYILKTLIKNDGVQNIEDLKVSNGVIYTNLDYDKYQTILNLKKSGLVIICSEYAMYCGEYEKELYKLQENTDVELYYLDESFIEVEAVPMTIVLQDGQIIDEFMGIKEYKELIKIFPN